MDKVQLIQNSVSCFWSGMVGCVPLLGLPFAVHALWKFSKIKQAGAGEWNPARAWLLWGLALGTMGVLITISCILIVGLVIISRVSQSPD